METKIPEWFAPHDIGRGFVGDRTRLHVATITVVAPNAVEMEVLCGASEVTRSTNLILDPDDEQSCRDWWGSKVRVDAEQGIDKSLRGGLAKPRVCGDCKTIHDGAL